MKIVELHTTLGVITLQLDDERAPISVANFLAYVNSEFYEGTLFHRVIKGFIIQGGGFNENMKMRAADKPIENEATNGLKNEKYTLAMARTAAPHSASCQFFINTASNSFLNYRAPQPGNFGYAVFGKVIGGTDVVDKIDQVKTKRSGFYDDVPVDPVVITKAVEIVPTVPEAEA